MNDDDFDDLVAQVNLSFKFLRLKRSIGQKVDTAMMIITVAALLIMYILKLLNVVEHKQAMGIMSIIMLPFILFAWARIGLIYECKKMGSPIPAILFPSQKFSLFILFPMETIFCLAFFNLIPVPIKNLQYILIPCYGIAIYLKYFYKKQQV